MEKTTNFTKGQILILGICILLSMKGLYTLSTGLEITFDAANWISSEAKVLESRLDRIFYNKYGPTYRAVITYQYVMDDTTYINDVFTVPNRTMTKNIADKKIRRYPEGRDIKIWVDPKNPMRSAIEKPTFDWWFVFVYGFFSCFLIWIVTWLYREFRNQ